MTTIETTPSKQILLAEDNPADVMLVREALKEQHIDCTLQAISDGAQAITFIESLDRDSKTPGLDLLLLDMNLPKCDGEEILKRLRSTDRSAQTPVIIMTASDSPRTHHAAQRHAALHYFRKPSNFDEYMELGLIVRRILAKANSVDDVTPAPSKHTGAA